MNNKDSRSLNQQEKKADKLEGKKADKLEHKKEQYDRRQQIYAYWLHSIPGIGNRTIARLLTAFESPENLYFLSTKVLETELKPAQISNLIVHKKEWNLYTEYDKLEAAGIRFLPKKHPDYPERLLSIPDAPEVIYIKGTLPVEKKLSIAIVGARKCSEYGVFEARNFGRQLGAAGIQIISGFANGVDSIGQQAAVEAGGETYAVMGCGVDICYPASQRQLYETIQEKGGIISEFLPGTLSKPGNFPPRNRIISGLSDVLLVIEAKQKSGTLITVDMALEQGREVFVLPGRITDSLSEGCNCLIRQGAGIALSPADLIRQLTGIQSTHSGTSQSGLSLTKEEKMLMEYLDFYPTSIDAIFNKMTENKVKITLQELIRQLMDLCIKQLAIQVSSNHYCRKSAEF